ncbi:hypothetical protein EVAR_33204_1 [Eumeta japonica]|uniref:Uncharacterized protein n=1 Tax=Eumeta variegata TaxID=151549 RepID=A0A4C1W3M5_EUMVA|nr:hypothetical protein EVAR_33204_1 [Eumeta japonica]
MRRMKRLGHNFLMDYNKGSFFIQYSPNYTLKRANVGTTQVGDFVVAVVIPYVPPPLTQRCQSSVVFAITHAGTGPRHPVVGPRNGIVVL